MSSIAPSREELKRQMQQKLCEVLRFRPSAAPSSTPAPPALPKRPIAISPQNVLANVENVTQAPIAKRPRKVSPKKDDEGQENDDYPSDWSDNQIEEFKGRQEDEGERVVKFARKQDACGSSKAAAGSSNVTAGSSDVATGKFEFISKFRFKNE